MRGPAEGVAILAGVCGLCTCLPATAQPRQPEVVCDLGPVTVGTIEAGTLRTREAADTIRITFRDIDPKAGTARVTFGEGASGEEFAAVTVGRERHNLPRQAGRRVQDDRDDEQQGDGCGWPALMSQHG